MVIPLSLCNQINRRRINCIKSSIPIRIIQDKATFSSHKIEVNSRPVEKLQIAQLTCLELSRY